MKYKLLGFLVILGFFQSIKGQSVTYAKQPSNTVGLIGGTADFSFSVTVPIVFANLGISVFKDNVNASSRFTVTSRSIGNNVTSSGNYTSGDFTITISGITSSDFGSYVIKVYANDILYANSSSQAVTLTLGALAPPVITTQPRNQTASGFGNFTLNVVANGTSLSYQWYRNGSVIGGAKSATYTPDLFATSSDTGIYYVVVTNSGGSVTSDSAIVTISSSGGPTISTQPSNINVLAGQSATFTVGLNYSVFADSTTYLWLFNNNIIPGANGSSYTIPSVKEADVGNYSVLVSNIFGSVLSSNAALQIVTYSAPTITSQPVSSTILAGQTFTVSVIATGVPSPSYQWYKGNTAINGATSSTYRINSVASTDAGSYFVVVSNSVGSITSNAATLTLLAPRLSNLSVRTALDADQIVIVGFTMSGGAKNVVLRAAGPTLSAFNVPSVMADPKLDLYSGSTKVNTNDNWGGSSSLSAAFQSVGAFAYSSTTSLDAALVTSIDGGRTVQVSGPTAGTVLVEGYDAGSGDTQRFSNLSARNKVGTGGNILIAGFTLTGSGTRNLLIRAVGPTLSNFGVPGVLADPKLEIYSGTTKVTENDNWSSALSATFTSVGAFSLNAGSKDAAITVSLPAGGYTVQVSGADGGVGEAIVEIYELP